jgi:Lon protease-like protein
MGCPVELPLFPLETVLYPGAPIPLHVFEERYRLMFARVLAAEGPERRFGVVAIVEGGETGRQASFRAVGCVAEVRQVRPYPDGRLDVVAQGRERFRIESIVQSTPYIIARVRALDERAGVAAESRMAKARGLFVRYLRVLLALAGETEPTTVEVPEDPIAASYLFASGLQVGLDEKQRLLALDTADERLRVEIGLLRREVALLAYLNESEPAPMAGPFSLN